MNCPEGRDSILKFPKGVAICLANLLLRVVENFLRKFPIERSPRIPYGTVIFP